MVQILTGPRFARALRAGALAVVREQETLNRINVFPVADADTGANLASTLRAAAGAMIMPNIVTVGQSARAAADAALDGARGNSGAIIAQFFHGIAECLGNRVQVTTQDFAAAVRRGVEAAYQALQQPTEGTILSVVREWASSLEEQARSVSDFADLLAHGLERARKALANTPKQLAVLAKHGVVDAGAQGFVFFLEGISSIFRDRRAADWQRAGLTTLAPTPFAAAHAEVDTTHRFCAEGLVRGIRLDRKAVAAAVAPLGTSLVVAGGGSRLRVHLHTNEPQRLFGVLATFGTLERTKTDDMILQQLAARQARIALVTDSGCDLPEAVAHGLGIVRVPFTFRLGEESFLDGVDITPHQFYQLLQTERLVPATSQPAVGDFKRTFSRLLERHEAVVVITISSGLSGCYQAAVAAAASVDPRRIRVIDSRQLSVAAGLVAEAAGDAIARELSLDEVERAASAAAANVRLFAALPSLDTAARGGRVPRHLARLSEWLHLKPILTLDREGKAAKAGAHLGFRRALRGIARRAARFADGAPAQFLIAHANAVGAAEFVAQELSRRCGATEIPLVNLAPVLASHTGPGAVGVAVRRGHA